MKALSSSADIVIGGAAAGVGKTAALLLEPLRNIDVPGFGGVIFRRTTPQISNEGGLWDTSLEFYPHAGGIPKESRYQWDFPKGSKIRFQHLEYEKDILAWQGAQVPFIGFDELTHFSKRMFFYMLTRNRSVCGVRPYIRATCNPDPESWVYEFVQWWIDPETGLPIPERDGVLRYLMRDGDAYIWGDSFEETLKKGAHLLAQMPEGMPLNEFVKTVTFISGSIYDNKKLLQVNSSYLGNLLAQDEETKSQLFGGCWKRVPSDKDIYDVVTFNGLFDNVREVDRSRKCITADIAMEGSNIFVVMYWEGFEVMDLVYMEKSGGTEVIAGISEVAKYHGVNNWDIIYDADGVGAFVGGDAGFIPGAVPFHGGAAALPVMDPASDTLIKENYFNLRAQCYYRSGLAVRRGERKINPAIHNVMFNNKRTIRQQFAYERQAIKKAPKTPDGKLKIISKDEMKAKLNGDSPDVMDAFAMREALELVNPVLAGAW